MTSAIHAQSTNNHSFLEKTCLTGSFLFRSVKLVTWVNAKTAIYKLMGQHEEAKNYYDTEYKVMTAARNALFPSQTIDPSRQFNLDGRHEVFERRIGYINGISTPFDQAKWDAIRFSDEICSGKDLHCVWNAPHGGLKDYVLTVQMMYFDAFPAPCERLIDTWTSFFEMNKKNDVHFLQICYSQSSLFVRNAMKELPEHYRKRLSIIAIGPSCFINSGGSEIRHFVKREDAVPTKFAAGSSRLNNPNDQEVVIVTHDDNTNPHDPHGSRYIEAIKPYVDRYLSTGKML